MEQSNSSLNNEDVKQIITPDVKKLVNELDKKNLSNDQQIDLLLEVIIGMKRCEMTEKDFNDLDNTLDEAFSKRLGNKGETLSNEMIEILKKRACQWKRQKGGVSIQLLILGLAFAATAVQGSLTPFQIRGVENDRALARQGKNPNFNANFLVEIEHGRAPVIEKNENMKKQVQEINEAYNQPINVMENIYDYSTPDNIAWAAGAGAVVGLAVAGPPALAAGGIVAGGAAGMAGMYQIVLGGVAAKEGANVMNKAGEEVIDGIKNIKGNIAPGPKEIQEYKGKVLPLINLIDESPYEFKNIEEFKNINKIDRLELNGLNTQQIGNVKKLITLAYLHKSVDSYISYISFIFDKLDATFDEAPPNLSLEVKEAKLKLNDLKDNLQDLRDNLPGNKKKVQMYNVHDKVMAIMGRDELDRVELQKDQDPYKQHEPININADKNTQINEIQKILDDPSIKEIIAPDGIQEVQRFFNNQLYDENAVINNLYNDMKKIGKGAKELEGERSHMYEAIASGALALAGIYIVFPLLYRFFFPKKSKTGGKKTKKKHRKHNTKSKKIRPHKTSKRRVKKHKSKRKHK